MIPASRGLAVAITEQHTEESLCFAHIYALAGVAGVNYSANRYDYGVDGHFIPVRRRGNRFIDSGFPLDHQAKATINWELKDGKIVYDLEAKTYNDLVGRTAAESSIILILLCLPKEREQWHSASSFTIWFLLSEQTARPVLNCRLLSTRGRIVIPFCAMRQALTRSSSATLS